MNHRFLAGAVVAAVIAISACDAGDAFKSGVPVGGNVKPFHPLNITGPDKDNKQCLV